MKKTLLVLATLAATAGFAQAARRFMAPLTSGSPTNIRTSTPLVLLTNTVLKTAT